MPNTSEPMAGRILSVGGGKGGVGKSLIAANLAVAMAKSGAKTILVDADLGAANLQTLFGLNRVPRTLNQLFSHEIDSLQAALTDVGVPGLQLIPGSSALDGSANLTHTQKLKLIRQIHALAADVVIVDVGAGVSFNVVDLFNAADLRVLVLTPQLTSIQNAYGFLKGSVFRLARQMAAQLGHEAAFANAGETQRLPTILAAIAERDRAAAAGLQGMLDNFGAQAIGNNLFDANQQSTLHAVGRMVRDFLGTRMPILGFLRASRGIHDSVNQRRPFAIDGIPEESSRLIAQMAQQLLAEDPGPMRDIRRRLKDPREWVDGLQNAMLETQLLPAKLESYDRVHPRYAVQWMAHLSIDGKPFEVMVEDVSLSGARLSGAPELPLGQLCGLSFPEFVGASHLQAVVRHSNVERGAGVEFVGRSDLPEKLVAAALETARLEADASLATQQDE